MYCIIYVDNSCEHNVL